MTEGATLHYLTFDSIGITVAVIAIALTFIVLVWNSVRAIHDWRQMANKPVNDKFQTQAEQIKDHEDRITHLEECCEEVHGKLNADWQFQQEEIEMNRLLLKAIKQLLKHSLDGNDAAGLKVAEQEIDLFLVNHAQ